MMIVLVKLMIMMMRKLMVMRRKLIMIIYFCDLMMKKRKLVDYCLPQPAPTREIIVLKISKKSFKNQFLAAN